MCAIVLATTSVARGKIMRSGLQEADDTEDCLESTIILSDAPTLLIAPTFETMTGAPTYASADAKSLNSATRPLSTKVWIAEMASGFCSMLLLLLLLLLLLQLLLLPTPSLAHRSV